MDCEIGLEGFLFLCEREVPDVRGHCMIAELEKQGQQPVQLAICIVSNAGHIFGRDPFIIGTFPFSFRPEFIGHCLYTGNEPCFAPVVQHMADEVRLMVFTENGLDVFIHFQIIHFPAESFLGDVSMKMVAFKQAFDGFCLVGILDHLFQCFIVHDFA